MSRLQRLRQGMLLWTSGLAIDRSQKLALDYRPEMAAKRKNFFAQFVQAQRIREAEEEKARRTPIVKKKSVA
jgi:hypothetical protein